MLFKVIVLFILVLGICSACDMDQTKDGCRIRNGICSCGFGCISEYRYETMAECNSALKGLRVNGGPFCISSAKSVNLLCPYEQFYRRPKKPYRKRRDSCYPNPCMNGGSCIQISQRPYFICRCDGTGYFGQRCHRACPTPGGASGTTNVFPYECIVI